MSRPEVSSHRSSTGAAMLFSVATHVCILVGLAQYGARPSMTKPGPKKLDSYPPIEVTLIAPAVPKLDTPAAQSVAARPSSLPEAHRPQSASVQASLQARQPAPGGDIHPAPNAVAEGAKGARPDAAPTEARHAASKESTVADGAGFPGGHLAATNAHSGERRPDPNSVPGPAEGARPDYAYNPQPDYPLLLREQGVGGVVWLRVLVDSEGRPGEVQLARGSGYRLLDDAALRAVRQWLFIPAKNGDQKLASWVEFAVRFALNGQV